MMKLKYLLVVVAFIFLTPVALAADSMDSSNSSDDLTSKLTPRRLFIYETNQEDASDSLDRISGHYDLGFSSPSQTFQSEDHYKPGPFSRQKSTEKLE